MSYGLIGGPDGFSYELKIIIGSKNTLQYMSEEDLTALFPHPTGPINLTESEK